MKKITAILLSLSLVFCMMPNTAFAFTENGNTTENVLADGEEVDKIEVTSKIPDKVYDGVASIPEMTVAATLVKKSDDGTLTSTRVVTLDKNEYRAEITSPNKVDVGAVTITVTEKLTEAKYPSDATKTAKTCPATYNIIPLKIDWHITVRPENGETLLVSDFSDDGTFTAGKKIAIWMIEKDENGQIKKYVKKMSAADYSAYLDVSYEKVIKENPVSKVNPYKTYRTYLKVNVNPKQEAIAKGNVTGSMAPELSMKKQIGDCKVRPEKSADLVYNGQKHEPAIVVEEEITVKNDDNKEEKEEKVKIPISKDEYEVEYLSNIDAGQCYVIVTGKGDNYTGTEKYPLFTIQQKNIASGVMINISTGNSSTTPTVTATYNNMTLVKDKDFTVESNDKTVTIRGIGNYGGVIERPYKVVEKSITSVTCTTSKTYNNAEQKPILTVKSKEATSEVTLTEGTDYTVTYTKDGKQAVPKESGKYKVIVTGMGEYAGTFSNDYTIKPVPLSEAEIVLSKSTTTWNGQKVPKITVKHSKNNFNFVEKSDYRIEYRNLDSTDANKKPLVAVISTNKGNLTSEGSSKKELTMNLDGNTGSIASCTVSFTDGKSSKVYDGKAVKPTVVVRNNSQNKNLTLNTDYTVAYKDAAGKAVTGFTETGTYKVVVTGKGNYTGEQALNYSITATNNDISHYTVTLDKSSVNATGSAQRPTIVSVKYTTLTLSPADYNVTYQDSTGKTVTSMISPGTYRVVVTGKNGYTGSTYATFRIVGLPQEIKIAKTAYKVYKDSPDITIEATATGDGTGFSYVSSDPSVATVSANGVVTIHKIGRAKITVTTTGVKKSDPVSDDVYVKVYPDKTMLTQKPFTEGKKRSFRTRWNKQDDVTYYEVRYCRNSKFKPGTYSTKKVKNATWLNYSTQSTQVKTSYSKRRYYVKVRAVKVVYNDYGKALRYYGKWSKWRSVVTR